MEGDLVSKNVFFLGNCCIGISSLFHAFENDGQFRKSYGIKIYDSKNIPIKFDNVEYSVTVHRTIGLKEYEAVRKSHYPKVDCFVLCYSLDDRDSFISILNDWYDEVKDLNKPIILLGTKCDLINQSVVKDEDVENMKQLMNANCTLNCSSRTNVNLTKVLQEALRAAAEGVPTKE